MWKLRSLVCLLLLYSATLAVAQGSGNRTSLWKTLDGSAPLVIARGGFSGLLADSSLQAYQVAGLVSLPNVVYWCDVQLTKDGAGVCFPNLNLQNGSNIANIYPNKKNSYSVNGKPMQGWFTVDFTLNDLTNVSLVQRIYSRPDKFDGTSPIILTVQQVIQLGPPGFWLNIQNNVFYSQQKLNMRSFVLAIFRSAIVDYVSSPEVSFLRSILARKPSRTKLIFRFMGQNDIEPSTNQTYGSLLQNLTFIKTFASGILVPKTYIWPTDENLYLLPHTSVVLDAHKAGLQVFASDFANDADFAYNFSFDPVAEYLSYIDNGEFSVDGVLSDFPITPSEAIGCFSHIGKNASGQATPLVISSKGSSGDYPGCTDLAYQKAISDGVDILDCPVQMSKDGIPFCLGSINLLDSTTIAQSDFNNLTISIPELGGLGIYAFNLTWSQIRGLEPSISNPYAKGYDLFRNPKFKNSGKFMTLSEFLAVANNVSSVSGVLISIEDAAYLAEKQGLDVTDAVLDALKNVGYSNQMAKKVMIKSANSSVLIKFQEKSTYDLVYKVDENIRDADNLAITEISKFAHSVVVSKSSVFPDHEAYITGMTDVVRKLQAFKLLVYAELFRNEFVSQDWDFYSDATVEINNFVMGAGVDGVVTEFPGTAARYKRNRCLGLGNKTPMYMNPVPPGGLFQFITPSYMPPAEAPNPVLSEADVAEPPLAPVAAKAPTPGNGNGSTAAAPTPPSGQPKLLGCIVLSYLAVLATVAVF